MKTKKLTLLSLLTAIALTIFMVEAQIPALAESRANSTSFFVFMLIISFHSVWFISTVYHIRF